MQKRVFIIHGWGGSPQGGCIPWLKYELELEGFTVVAPQMPNTEKPTIDEWVAHLASLVGTPDENTYFIGHSIGCQTIMRYLETVDQEIGGAIFIAGWINLENLAAGEIQIARPWIQTPIDFEKLKSLSNKYALIISDNDPFGGMGENIAAFNTFCSQITILSNTGHIEQQELPEALEALLYMAK